MRTLHYLRPLRAALCAGLALGVASALAETPQNQASGLRWADASERARVDDAGMVGTWEILRGRYSATNAKVVFRRDGTFAFSGAGSWRSEGEYTVRDGQLRLVWTSIDGERVERGTVRKTIDLWERDFLTVDRYTYERVAGSDRRP